MIQNATSTTTVRHAGKPSFLADNAGSSMIEFAFCAAILLTTVFGIMNCGLILYTDHYVVGAARDGARYAMVRGSGWNGVACAAVTDANCTTSSATVKAYVLSRAPLGVTSSKINVTTGYPGTTAAGGACYSGGGANGAGCSVKVTVAYTYNFAMPLVPTNLFAFTSSDIMPITQ